MTKRAQRRLKAKVNEKLDQALKDSFPASDPVAFTEPAPSEPAGQAVPAGKDVGGKDKD
jgi:hypothetical protein